MNTSLIQLNSAAHWSGADPEGRWIEAALELVPGLAADAARHDETGDFVTDGISAVRGAGLVSMLVPEEVGGGGATFADTAAVLATLAHGCPSTALTLSMHSHLVAAQVWRHHRDLPAPVLAKVAAAQAFLVSTGAGDWVASYGSARPVEGGFRVSARKAPSSGAPAGDILVSSARVEGPTTSVIHFSVPFGAPGVSIDPTWDTMGMRGTGSHTVVLDDVFVPAEAVSLTRDADVWHPVWNTVMGVAMPLIMSVYVGVAEAAAARAIELAAARPDPAAAAVRVGRMLNRLRTAQAAAGRMVAMADDLRFDNVDQHAATVLSLKSVVAEAVLLTTRTAMEVAGGAGYARATGLERLHRDAHGALYHPLPEAAQEQFSGRVALGLSPVTA